MVVVNSDVSSKEVHSIVLVRVDSPWAKMVRLVPLDLGDLGDLTLPLDPGDHDQKTQVSNNWSQSCI